jgi:hypothetical protein
MVKIAWGALMKFVWFPSVAAACAGSILAGCAGVAPILSEKESPIDLNPSHLKASNAATVDNITDHIACEIYKSGKRHPTLVSQEYYIKIFLTLQVDDQFDLTPSLTWMNPLSKMTSFSGILSGDFGLQRRRTFTTTYNINAKTLSDDYRAKIDANSLIESECDSTPLKNELYKLSGNLGIDEIIDDGLKIVNKENGVITNPSKPGDNNAPSFGSQVQFIITRQITALGPTWALKYFKGPSGSNGLINGKTLDTDSVVLTFVPQLVSGAQRAKIIKERATQTNSAKAERDAENAKYDSAKKTVDAMAHNLVAVAPEVLQQRQDDLARADAARTTANERVRRAEVAQAEAEAPQVADNDAANASESLLTSILLQNLANLPR